MHRIGRTGRAGKEGTAITFVTPEEYRGLMFIKSASKTDIRKEKLPKIEDIINTKKARIKRDIEDILKSEDYKEYVKIALDFLETSEPEKVLAALLKYSFQDELDEKNYNEIREPSIDDKGKTRLFVGLGKRDGMTPKKLVNFIKQEPKVNDKKIKDVKIFDKFSFITVPFGEAEILLDIFKRKKDGE